MSFWWRVVLAVVCTCVIAAVWLVAAPPVVAASLGSQSLEPDLDAMLLDSRDVPPGFELDAKQSGLMKSLRPHPVGFHRLCSMPHISVVTIPSDPARTLALLGSPTAGWSAVTADQRTEWTYAEALVTATTIATSTLTMPNTETGP